MKKIISTVAALGLVVGVAGTASALDLSVSGKYVLEGYMMSGADGTGVNPYDDEAGTDSGWVHTFVVNPQLKVNDKISMFSELRFAKDTDWGNANNYDGDTGLSLSDTYDSPDQSTMDVYLLYMEYMSPAGKIRAGRVATGSWGSDFISSASHGDRLMWWPSFVADPFSLCVYTQKSQENDWYNGSSDSDYDSYEIDLTYKVEGINLRAAYDYFNDKSSSDAAIDGYNPNILTQFDRYDKQFNRLKVNADMKFGDIAVVGEWGWQFGDYRDFDDEVANVQEDRDQDAMALMLDASYKMDKLNVGLLYFWAEGQDEITTNANGEDVTAAMQTLDSGIGDDFNPYYILTGDHTGMLNSDEYAADAWMTESGVSAIGIYSDFKVSDQLTLHGAVGFAWADSTDVREDTWGISVDDEYGWEVDLGAKYKLLDNLTYEVRAGYLNAGDFFDDIATHDGTDSDDVYLLSHHLTMTF